VSRITDPMKIDRIKKAVMELMCDHGYNHMSISLISEKSGVSSGYLCHRIKHGEYKKCIAI